MCLSLYAANTIWAHTQVRPYSRYSGNEWVSFQTERGIRHALTDLAEEFEVLPF